MSHYAFARRPRIAAASRPRLAAAHFDITRDEAGQNYRVTCSPLSERRAFRRGRAHSGFGTACWLSSAPISRIVFITSCRAPGLQLPCSIAYFSYYRHLKCALLERMQAGEFPQTASCTGLIFLLLTGFSRRQQQHAGAGKLTITDLRRLSYDRLFARECFSSIITRCHDNVAVKRIFAPRCHYAARARDYFTSFSNTRARRETSLMPSFQDEHSIN